MRVYAHKPPVHPTTQVWRSEDNKGEFSSALPPREFPGWNSGRQVWQQVPFYLLSHFAGLLPLLSSCFYFFSLCVCVFRHACVCMCMYVHMYAGVCVDMHVRMYAGVCARVCGDRHVCACACMFVCMQVCVCVQI